MDVCLVDVAFSSACSRNLVTRALHNYCMCILNHLADGILSKLMRTSVLPRRLKHTMQEFCVLRNIHSPAFEVVVHFRRGDEEASVDVQMHGMCAVQTSVVVDNVAP